MKEKYRIPYRINAITGMWTGFFTDRVVDDYASALESDRICYERFFKSMLEEGIFFAPSPFEASFVTSQHGEEELSRTIDAFDRVFAGMAKR